MADRKAISLTFPTPEGIGLGDLKAGIQKENCSFSKCCADEVLTISMLLSSFIIEEPAHNRRTVFWGTITA